MLIYEYYIQVCKNNNIILYDTVFKLKIIIFNFNLIIEINIMQYGYNGKQKVISCRLLVYFIIYIYNYVDNLSNFQHKLK